MKSSKSNNLFCAGPKYLLLASLLAVSLLVGAQGLNRHEVRQYFLQALRSRSALDSFQHILGSGAVLSAAEESYAGICNALQIQYTCGILGKYQMLDRSRGHINHAVQLSPHDAEFRFIRFMVEHNIPAILGMSTHIREDLSVIFAHFDFMDEEPELKRKAVEFLLASKRCTAAQIKQLEKAKNEYALR